jgi:hypothetical protein
MADNQFGMGHDAEGMFPEWTGQCKPSMHSFPT